MPEASASRTWTLIGLVIALFGIPVVVTAYRLIVPDPAATGSIVLRELAILALVAFLLWIVVKRERLPLTSIGISFDGLWRSLAWGLAAAVVIVIGLVACLALFSALGVRYGSDGGGGGAISMSIWATLLAVVRAGIAEEVFYRGFALQRIETLSGSTWLAAAITIIGFAAFHYRQGLPGIFIALVLGAIITAFYIWKRNLIAVIFAHFLIDFVPNVVLPLLGSD